MIINKIDELAAQNVEMEGAKNVILRVLIGPDNDSENIIMRHFTVMPGGYTPHHEHDFEHIVKIEKNKGIIVDKKGREHQVTEGHSAYIPANEIHQFKNPHDKPFEFLCIIVGQKN